MSNVLIVDDRAENREYICSLLNHFGHHLIEAEDGDQGLSALRQSNVDLIITDILMPKMDGYEFVHEIKKEPKFLDIPIIFYTATYRKDEAQMLANDLGVNYVLAKPAEPQSILDLVNKALGTSSRKGYSDVEKLSFNSILPENTKNLKNIKKIIFQLFNAKMHDEIKINNLINNNKISSQDRKLLLTIFQQFKISNNQTKYFSKKLYILLELTIELFGETDINKLLKLLCQGAHKIVEAEYACAGIFDNEGSLIYFGTNVFQEKNIMQTINDTLTVKQPYIKDILKKSSAFYNNNVSSILSEQVPFYLSKPINLLAAPLLTSSRVYGFIYFTNKINKNEFTLNDISLIDVLTSVMAKLYENIELYDLIQNHAAKLQIEIGKRKEAQVLLSENELMFRQFSENIEEVFFRFTPEFDKVIYVSPAYTNIWKRPIKTLYDNALDWMEVILDEDKERLNLEIQNMKFSLGKISTKFRIKHPNRYIRHIHLKASCVMDKYGGLTSIIGIASDITDIVLRQDRDEITNTVDKILNQSQSLNDATSNLLQLFIDIYHCQYCEIWLIDKIDNVLRNVDVWHKNDKLDEQFAMISKEYSFMIGEDFPGKIWEKNSPLYISDFSENISYPRYLHACKVNLKHGLGFPLIYQDEVYGIIDMLDSNIPEPDQEVFQVMSMIGQQIGDFLNKKYSQDQLVHLAKYDILTGLMNKASIENILQKQIQDKPNQYLPILVFGIDRFHFVNEGFGYDAGDKILCLFSKKLMHLDNTKVIPFRLSGGKFGIVPLNIMHAKDLDSYANKLLCLFQLPAEIFYDQILLSVSIGISTYPHDGLSSRELIKNAEIALRLSKSEGGGNHIKYFSQDVSQKISEKIILQNDIRIALDNEQFMLYYQPKVNLKTKEITGAEALIRWNHPEKGIISPLEFIAISEETNLIIPIGDWVLLEACKTLKILSSINSSLSMSVNISIRQFNEDDFIEKLQKIICMNSIDAQKLDLEITESLLMNNLMQFNKQFEFIKKSIGAKFSLDDFGTGYSSLNYLAQVKIDTLKIDQSFIRMIPKSNHHIAIVKAIISMTKSLGIKCIAEGVENKEQWDFLLHEGCDEIQGYYYSPPIPFDELIKLLAR